MAYSTDLTDAQWRLLAPVLGRGGSRGPQPALDRRLVVNAVLYQAKTGCQWRMLPAEFGSWNTIWRTFARWRDRGVWQQVMDVLRRHLRVAAGRDPEPSLLMVDCQVVKGGRCGADFHEGHYKYRLRGAKRAVAVDYLGLPVTVNVTGARTHEVKAARQLLDRVLPEAARVATVMGDRGFRGLATQLERAYGVETVIKHDENRPRGEFRPLQPLWKVEAAFADLGRWRRLARSFEGTSASATAWMQVAAVGVMLRQV
ncbi:IS5 family transposase [Planosporangium flavigriseum]|uniref:IS5 family transposase n=1 Tax=Planosporangium flavigriseum TaxID=373681 RepID=UPI001438EE7F|nr:IS5 family transposase [Planosporangium flavigriseum]NJC64181.1 IS5 family transposase [Planosporangium flavigriseum]